MMSAPPGVTKPDAGVMATRPATAPQAAPTTLTLRVLAYDTRTQVVATAAAGMVVTGKARGARRPAVRGAPALNPNQPNHSRPAPRTVIGTSCGSLLSPFMWRFP